MSNSPSTFGGDSHLPEGIRWDQDATLHHPGDSGFWPNSRHCATASWPI
jgi:hypothetical protein